MRHAQAQAYDHASNGRAEVAGQQVKEILRILCTQEKLNWVEALPRVLFILHNARGETGLTPYEIVFGRPRPIAGLPYDPPRDCEKSREFMNRMAEIDKTVADKLNDMHTKLASRLNKNRKLGKF